MISTTCEPQVRPISRGRTNTARFFYVGATLLLSIFVFLGFQRFYLHGQPARGNELFAPMKTVLIVHGLAMTGWVLLLVAQSLLIVSNQRRVHMTLGICGAILAACILVLNPWISIVGVRLKPDIVRFGIHSKSFLAVQFGDMMIFGVGVAIGLWNRHRPHIHRPMMLLATMGVMGAAVSRIAPVRLLYETTIVGQVFASYTGVLVLGAILVAVKTALTRSLDRWLAGGYVVLVLSCACIIATARSETWERIVNQLIH